MVPPGLRPWRALASDASERSRLIQISLHFDKRSQAKMAAQKLFSKVKHGDLLDYPEGT